MTGVYTARAIAHFAYQRKVPVVDVNIRRVIYRIWLGVDQTTAKKADMTLMNDLMQSIKSTQISLPSAFMEFGALICTARNPQCEQCPVSTFCAWLCTGKPANENIRTIQKYLGTDRYVRGLLLDLLRGEFTPIEPARIHDVWPDEKQRIRAINSLLADGLIEQNPMGNFSLAQ